MSCTRVRVKYTPPHLRELAGAGEEELEICETPVTLESLLRKLLEKHGYALFEQLYDEKTGDLRSGVIIVVNGVVAHKLGEVLENRSEVTITIAYDGG